MAIIHTERKRAYLDGIDHQDKLHLDQSTERLHCNVWDEEIGIHWTAI